MSDEYRKRMLQVVDELHAQGVGRYTSAPPLYRLAWRLGIHVPPPMYRSFRAVALELGASFAVGYGLLMWLFFWRADQHSALRMVVTAVIAGVGFGWGMAMWYRHRFRSVRLPSLPTK